MHTFLYNYLKRLYIQGRRNGRTEALVLVSAMLRLEKNGEKEI